MSKPKKRTVESVGFQIAPASPLPGFDASLTEPPFAPAPTADRTAPGRSERDAKKAWRAAVDTAAAAGDAATLASMPCPPWISSGDSNYRLAALKSVLASGPQG